MTEVLEVSDKDFIQEMVKDREAWHAVVQRVTESDMTE